MVGLGPSSRRSARHLGRVGQKGIAMLNNAGLPGLLLLFLYGVIIVLPFYKLWKRTGHNGWISLLMVVPVVNLIMLYVLAFKRWPNE